MSLKLQLTSLRVQNFKAVRDSKTIRFTPLTVFVGNNGSGKSSVVEALETLQIFALNGLDAAMLPWHGFEYILNQAAEHKLIGKQRRFLNPMQFELAGKSQNKPFKANIQLGAELTEDNKFNKIIIQKYQTASMAGKTRKVSVPVANGKISDQRLEDMVRGWQFLGMIPQSMTEPLPQKRTYGGVMLEKDGSNIAEYLQSVRDKDIGVFNEIVETVKLVFPFAEELQPAITSELDRKVYLALSEKNIKIKLPGWLLSTGTLRILTLLCALRDPDAPSVLIIEEIENGLDPRTIHMVVSEMQHFIESGRGQIIITTHSAYLLDLLPLSSIIVVERDKTGSPQFSRPADQKSLKKWAEQFSPGKLYTMGSLTRS